MPRHPFVFIVIPKPPLLAVVIVPRGFCPKMRPC
ncbi:rfbP protein [Vibrio cholerae]|nr:rfbP protein [Vibrio cholerae]EGR2829518.1 rfbP protein [Vibrio cholerae]TQQ29147.1 rfbP protein [Vibrio cholerae]